MAHQYFGLGPSEYRPYGLGGTGQLDVDDKGTKNEIGPTHRPRAHKTIDSIKLDRVKLLTSLWGNYSIPKDNPYTDDSDLELEVWALGLRNPWRCSFDSARPSYFYRADVGQRKYNDLYFDM
ncbi:hypothetical protein OsI_16798 [Oryza sativa Indica Group]|uniref:Uncharacterized protein n=1 Tax=Oryza sativa subsp. indica TaxID=39946 RepID=B8ASK5_ORYSI|nr:hypothetical protein OsI_16798 [Oryza sativa Indica Group]